MNEQIQKLRLDTQTAEQFFAAKLAYTLGPVELGNMLRDNKVKLIDVRYKEDFEASHIEGAVNMPKMDIEGRLNELSKNDVHVVYCYNQQCHLGAAAAYVFAKNGYPVMELEGGFKVWTEDFKFPVV